MEGTTSSWLAQNETLYRFLACTKKVLYHGLWALIIRPLWIIMHWGLQGRDAFFVPSPSLRWIALQPPKKSDKSDHADLGGLYTSASGPSGDPCCFISLPGPPAPSIANSEKYMKMQIFGAQNRLHLAQEEIHPVFQPSPKPPMRIIASPTKRLS